ncbi:MAG: ThuA domain-containing protein [Verrucomicrobiales bacterium]
MLISAKKDDAASGDKKKIVFIAGNRSHASGEHEFRAGCMLLANALNTQSGLPVEAVVVGADWKKDKSVLEGADSVVIYADGTSCIAGEWEYLDGLAKQGVGMMFMHYAVHPSKEQGEKYYQPWIGGAMESGWSVNPHWFAELEVDSDHQISRGVPEKFECLDELYYNMRFLEDRSKVLDLVTTIPTRDRMRRYINLWNKHGVEGLDKRQTVLWGHERENGGRGVGFTGGHYHHGWAIDGFRTVVLNAIVWTAGLEVPEGGVKSETLTEETLNANLDEYGEGKMRRLKLPDVAEWRNAPPAKIDTKREAKF